jgi:hypothetical protein
MFVDRPLKREPDSIEVIATSGDENAGIAWPMETTVALLATVGEQVGRPKIPDSSYERCGDTHSIQEPAQRAAPVAAQVPVASCLTDPTRVDSVQQRNATQRSATQRAAAASVRSL